MIDWLADEASYMESMLVSEYGGINDKADSPEEWRKAAQEAVKRDERL